VLIAMGWAAGAIDAASIAAAATEAPAATAAAAPAPSGAAGIDPAATPAPAGPALNLAPAAGAAAAPGNPAAAAALGPAEDIRDIRGPKFVWPWWLVPALLASVALLAVAGYGGWRWWQRRHRPRALLPFEVALERLEEIRALMQPATARPFSTAVSDIVRRYIELRFDVTATHRTTEEFLRDLLETSKSSLRRHRALLSEFLHQCDLVKFAGISLTLQNMESLHSSARVFVLETARPDPEPLPPDAAAPGPAPRPTVTPEGA